MFGIPSEPGVSNMTSPAEPSTKPSSTDRLLRRPEVEAMTGMSCSAIYRAMDAGTFPPPAPCRGRDHGGRRVASVRGRGVDEGPARRRPQGHGGGMKPCRGREGVRWRRCQARDGRGMSRWRRGTAAGPGRPPAWSVRPHRRRCHPARPVSHRGCAPRMPCSGSRGQWRQRTRDRHCTTGPDADRGAAGGDTMPAVIPAASPSGPRPRYPGRSRRGSAWACSPRRRGSCSAGRWSLARRNRAARRPGILCDPPGS